MEKNDFMRQGRDLYKPTRQFAVVDVPAFQFLMIDGHGDPNTSNRYAAAVSALYALSYAAKFASKRELGMDYTVLPLEGLWYSDDLRVFTARAKDDWSWTMMIRQPIDLPDALWSTVWEKAVSKSAAVGEVRLELMRESLAVQVMHFGPYDAEGPTIANMHQWIADHGYRETGHHHEIYLGDPRKSRPESLRTILRQPVLSAAAAA